MAKFTVPLHINKNGKVLGSDFRDYIEAAKIITVTVDLGGIINIPQEEGTNTRIGSSGYSVRHLVYKRSHKRATLSSDSLLDLGNQVMRYSNEDRKLLKNLKANMSALEKSYQFKFDDILKDWRMRSQASGIYRSIYGNAYDVYNVEISNYDKEVETIGKWVLQIKSDWNKVKSSKLIEKMI